MLVLQIYNFILLNLQEISNNFCASTANSIGNLFKTSLLKPFTIKAIAFWIPRWLQ
jgi:hypothetical protein